MDSKHPSRAARLEGKVKGGKKGKGKREEGGEKERGRRGRALDLNLRKTQVFEPRFNPDSNPERLFLHS